MIRLFYLLCFMYIVYVSIKNKYLWKNLLTIKYIKKITGIYILLETYTLTFNKTMYEL